MAIYVKAKLTFAAALVVIVIQLIPMRVDAADFLGMYGGYGGFGGVNVQNEADGWGALVTSDSTESAPEEKASRVHAIPGIQANATDGTPGVLSGDGGVAGSVSAHFTTHINITGEASFIGGTGGDGSSGSLAGAGGDVRVDGQNHTLTVSDVLGLAGGEGGTGGDNDAAGGNVALTNLKTLTVGTVSNEKLAILGGQGGGSAGAQGGSVTLAINETLTSTVDMFLSGGKDGTNGKGGNATVTAQSLRLGDDFSMQSLDSSKAFFAAQSVEFFNGTAATGHALELDASEGGVLTFSVGELIFDEAADPGKNPFKVTFTDTSAAASRADAEANGGVFIDTITLRNNARLDLSGAGTPGAGPGKTYNFNLFNVFDTATVTGSSDSLDFSGKKTAFALQKAGGYAAGDVVLHIDSTDAMNVSGGSLALGSFDSLWRFKANDSLVLIDKSTGSLAEVLAGGKALTSTGEVFQAYDGSGRVLSLQVLEDGVNQQHRLGVRGASVRETGKPLSMAARAGLSTVVAVQDAALRAFASSLPMKTSAGVAENRADPIQPLAIFGVDASSFRHGVGDRVSSQVTTLVAGPGVRFENSLGYSSLGAVFESAWGDYDTRANLDFGNTAHKAKGSGDVDSLGAALLFRHDFSAGAYGEASLRAGRVHMKFSSEHGSLGSLGSYEASSSYWGGLLGGGYVLSFGNTSLEAYNKLFWTRQQGFSKSINYPTTTRRLDVDAAESLRNRLGVRVSHSLGAHFNAFLGAAWEYEFNGKVSSRLDGGSIAPNSSKGHSGLGEIGFSFHPSEVMSLSLSGYGATGKRAGGGGSFSLCFVW